MRSTFCLICRSWPTLWPSSSTTPTILPGEWCLVIVAFCRRMIYTGISRVPGQNGVSQAWYIVEIHHSGGEPSICWTGGDPSGWRIIVLDIEGSRPEWCISSMIYSRDTPFWWGTLDLLDRWWPFRVKNHCTRYRGVRTRMVYLKIGCWLMEGYILQWMDKAEVKDESCYSLLLLLGLVFFRIWTTFTCFSEKQYKDLLKFTWTKSL